MNYTLQNLCKAAVLTTAFAFSGAQALFGHGSVADPVSRGYRIFQENPQTPQNAASAAAIAVAGTQAFYDWHEVSRTVANYDPNSLAPYKAIIPDGQLAGAGRDKYAGLNLQRADWPATAVNPGRYDVVFYAATVHNPSYFRAFITPEGWDPTQALRWDDMVELDGTENTYQDGANYILPVTFPQRSGRAGLYVVWQRIDPVGEVFFSFSDLDFSDGTGSGNPTNGGGGSSGGGDMGGGMGDSPEEMAMATFRVQSSWGSGFAGEIEIMNHSDSLINGWTIEFDFPGDINSVWNAVFVSREGNHYTFKNDGWNQALEPNSVRTFGFTAAPVTAMAMNFVLNGVTLGDHDHGGGDSGGGDTGGGDPDPEPVVPSVSIAGATVDEGDSGTKNAVFALTLSEATTQMVSVTAATQDGTAVANGDYTSTSTMVMFAAGQTTASVNIPVKGDTEVEPDETFTVKLSNPQGLTIANGTATGTIRNDDTASGGSGGGTTAGPLVVKVSDGWSTGFTAEAEIVSASALNGWELSFDLPQGIAGIWNADIVSHSGSRYTIKNKSYNASIPAGGKIQFGFNGASGVASGTVLYPANVTLNGTSLGGGTGGGTTPDPDPILPKLTISDKTIVEGDSGTKNVALTVKLSAASTETVTVKFSTVDGTAKAGSDYTAKLNQTLTFNPGETSKNIAVAVIGDTVYEPVETFSVKLSNPVGATLADDTGVATITDNDPVPPALPTLSINDKTVVEGDSGTKNVTFAVKLSAASTDTVTVKASTVDGTAKAGSDYTAKLNQTLTFNPGETSKNFSVAVIGDTAYEQTENFSVKLSSPVGATLADDTGVATITDMDQPLPGDGKPQTGDFNYAEAMQMSLFFYDAQRSGDLPDDFRVSWRGDSGMDDGSDVGLDLTGGFFDAGDHVKFGLPGAFSFTMLGWSAADNRAAWVETGQMDELLDILRWEADYLMRAHVRDANGDTVALYGQVGTGGPDHAYWGPPETMTMARPSYAVTRTKPGSDLAGESAAALAAMSMAFRPTDAAYADQLVDHAKALYKFADTYRGKYSDSIQDAAGFYNSWSGYNDELVWGALWLYRATGDAAYLTKAKTYYGQFHENDFSSGNPPWTLAWDDKSYGSTILLAGLASESKYKTYAQRWLDSWAIPGQGSRVKYSPGGQAWLDQWGSLRYSANSAFLALWYSKNVADVGTRYADFGEAQIDYALGANPEGRSYVVGFGEGYPINPHHRGAHGSLYLNQHNPVNNTHLLYGALVGGPGQANDGASYADDRGDYRANEVALDYNAGYTAALAMLYDEFGGKTLGAFPEFDGTPPTFDDLLTGGGGSGGSSGGSGGGSSEPPTGGSTGTASVSFQVNDNWGSGYTATVTVTNTGSSAINGWTVQFDLGVNLSGFWNATGGTKSGNTYTFNNESYNASIPVGGSVTFGVQAGSSADTTVENVVFNGTPATGGTSGGGSGSGDTGGSTGGGDTGGSNGGGDTGGGSNPGGTPTTDKKVVAYFPSWGIYQKGYNVADLPADKLTHIIHAFARISSAGEIEIIDRWADLEINLNGAAGNFGAYAKLKEQYPHLRVLIAVGGWFDSGKFSDVAATASARTKFAKSVRAFCVQYGFDGVDLDWEYPVVATDVNGNVRAADGENYALLAAAIRTEFNAQSALDGKTYEITAATPAGYDKFEKINLAALGQQLSWYNVMTYDYYGRWTANQTGYNAALFAPANNPSSRYNVDETISGYLAAGVPASKLVLGIPAYGYGWKGVSNPAPGSSASGVGPGTLSVEPGFYDYRTVADLVAANPANEKWDATAQTSYYYDGNLWISYDSPRAVRRKLDYVAEKNLGGVMFWEASTDIRTNGAANQLISIAADEM